LLAALLGLALILLVLIDVFETVVLPRTVMRHMRLSNVFFDFAGRAYIAMGKLKPGELRSRLLVGFAPIILLFLLAIWGAMMITGWALIEWGLQLGYNVGSLSLGESLYYSGVTFLTLGYGDIVPVTPLGRTVGVLEAGMGFGYIALVIGYVPVLYSAFSRRERQMLLLDTRAGSHPKGVEIVTRHAEARALGQLLPLLKEWEGFSAECLESYLSYPLLAYYRSQHDDQSWLKSLTAVLDACALIEVMRPVEAVWWDELHFQARATFAMARHLIVDLCYILDVPPIDGSVDRVSPAVYEELGRLLARAGVELPSDEPTVQRFRDVLRMYEPYVRALASELVLDLPNWCEAVVVADNWQVSAWEGERHF
jgi:hypothetical protein